MTSDIEEKTFQSAAKLNCEDDNLEGSETIPKGSTQSDSSSISEEDCGSAALQTRNGEDDEIVRNKYFIEFIEKVNKKFNNKFDYSKFEYKDAKHKSTIICPIHGEFQSTPQQHRRSTYGCPKCANENEQRWKNQSERTLGVPVPEKYLTKEEVLKRLTEKYGDTFVFDLDSNTWTGNTTIIKVYCKKHGWFEKKVHNLLMSNSDYGCNQCANENITLHKTHDKEKVFAELESIWNNKYIYTDEAKALYKNKKTHIPILCPQHGIFYKTFQKHRYQGCPECTKVQMKKHDLLPGGYTEKLFLERPELKNKPAFLYYLKVNDGEYYKIGITIISAKRRIQSLISEGKDFGLNLKFEIVCEKPMTLYEAFQKEQYVLKSFHKYRDFNQQWTTEIFKVDIFDSIKELFVEHIPTSTRQEIAWDLQ